MGSIGSTARWMVNSGLDWLCGCHWPTRHGGRRSKPQGITEGLVNGRTKMSVSGGEQYTHLLIPTSKTRRPAGVAVAHFMERMIQTGTAGENCELSFSKVVRVEPQVKERRNPFTGQTLKMRNRSRNVQPAQRLAAAGEIVALAEQEYDVSVASESRPHNPPFQVGTAGMDGTWQPFDDPYRLVIRCHVRDSLVRVCRFSSEHGHNVPRPDVLIPIDDEDCQEDETDGYFQHPELPDVIRIPNAGGAVLDRISDWQVDLAKACGRLHRPDYSEPRQGGCQYIRDRFHRGMWIGSNRQGFFIPAAQTIHAPSSRTTRRASWMCRSAVRCAVKTWRTTPCLSIT